MIFAYRSSYISKNWILHYNFLRSIWHILNSEAQLNLSTNQLRATQTQILHNLDGNQSQIMQHSLSHTHSTLVMAKLYGMLYLMWFLECYVALLESWPTKYSCDSLFITCQVFPFYLKINTLLWFGPLTSLPTSAVWCSPRDISSPRLRQALYKFDWL